MGIKGSNLFLRNTTQEAVGRSKGGKTDGWMMTSETTEMV
jgi:hypothetical protein